MSRHQSTDYKPTSSLTKPPASPKAIVRSGPADVRERSAFRGASWKPRRLELDAESLFIVVPSSNKRTRIPLASVAAIDRTDLGPHALSLRLASPNSKERRLHLAFAADSELYDWQDDIYSRAPQLGGYSSTPFDFVHKAHVGADVEGNFGDATVLPIYAEIVGGAAGPSTNGAVGGATKPATSPKASSLVVQAPRSRPASGIIALPTSGISTPPASSLQGCCEISQPGVFSRFRAKSRWVSLAGQVLTIHQGVDKTSPPSRTIPTSSLTRITPEAKRTHALQLEFTTKTRVNEVLYLSFGKDAEMRAWRDALSAPPPPPPPVPAVSSSAEADAKKARRQSRRRSVPLPGAMGVSVSVSSGAGAGAAGVPA